MSTEPTNRGPGNEGLPELEAAHFDAHLGETDALSNVRHSLRTPLNQIIGYSEMLMEELEEAGGSEMMGDLGKIHTAGGQLLALITDALAPWKLETGRIDLDTMRLEMRTPLNLIIGYSELCQEVAAESNATKHIADLQKITGAAKNLMALFNSASFPVRLETGVKATRPGIAARATLGGGEAGMRKAEDGDTSKATEHGDILIIDDNEMNRDMLCRRLERLGYTISEAENGLEALEVLKTRKFDLILLDVVMPQLNGFQTLERLKEDKHLQHIPVIMLSAMDEIDTAVRCIEIGAEDYIPKPFNPILLQARINASLEKKRLRDQEQAYQEILQIEHEKAERLLLNTLPESIAERMKHGETTIADHFTSATVMFADIADFTNVAASLSPAETVELLNELYSAFDWLAELHALEKIKTIADKYIAVGGLPKQRSDHASAVVEMALEMQKVARRFSAKAGSPLELRIGISTGPVIAGVIGRKKFVYDLWGDTMKIAGVIEDHAAPGAIQVSPATYEQLRNRYDFDRGASVEIKGKGPMVTHLLKGRKSRDERAPTTPQARRPDSTAKP